MSVVEEKRGEIAAFCEANGIEYLGVFGSYARGDFDEGSDVDMLVRFRSSIGLIRFARVELDMGALIGKKVDMVTEGGISELIKDSLNEEISSIYGQR